MSEVISLIVAAALPTIEARVMFYHEAQCNTMYYIVKSATEIPLSLPRGEKQVHATQALRGVVAGGGPA
jgi:hypothetical protein